MSLTAPKSKTRVCVCFSVVGMSKSPHKVSSNACEALKIKGMLVKSLYASSISLFFGNSLNFIRGHTPLWLRSSWIWSLTNGQSLSAASTQCFFYPGHGTLDFFFLLFWIIKGLWASEATFNLLKTSVQCPVGCAREVWVVWPVIMGSSSPLQLYWKLVLYCQKEVKGVGV